MRPVLDTSSFAPVPTLKHQNHLLSYTLEGESKYTVNVQCSVQYTLLLLYLMLVMSYCAEINNQTLPYLCMLQEYHVIYIVRYYPQFHITTEVRVLKHITHRYGGTTVHQIYTNKLFTNKLPNTRLQFRHYQNKQDTKHLRKN
jgi:hypothetical protein